MISPTWLASLENTCVQETYASLTTSQICCSGFMKGRTKFVKDVIEFVWVVLLQVEVLLQVVRLYFTHKISKHFVSSTCVWWEVGLVFLYVRVLL